VVSSRARQKTSRRDARGARATPRRGETGDANAARERARERAIRAAKRGEKRARRRSI